MVIGVKTDTVRGLDQPNQNVVGYGGFEGVPGLILYYALDSLGHDTADDCDGLFPRCRDPGVAWELPHLHPEVDLRPVTRTHAGSPAPTHRRPGGLQAMGKVVTVDGVTPVLSVGTRLEQQKIHECKHTCERGGSYGIHGPMESHRYGLWEQDYSVRRCAGLERSTGGESAVEEGRLTRLLHDGVRPGGNDIYSG